MNKRRQISTRKLRQPSRYQHTKPISKNYKPSNLRYQVLRIGSKLPQPVKIFDGFSLDVRQTTPSTLKIATTPSTPKIVFQHALLASKAYWTPFIRALNTQFQQLSLESQSHDQDWFVDCYLPDLTFHGETAMISDQQTQLSTDFNYLNQLTVDLEHFILNQVLTKEELEVVTNSNPNYSLDYPRVGIVGHSLGARAAMLFNLHKNYYIINNNKSNNNSNNSNPRSFTSIPESNNNDLVNQFLADLPTVVLDASPSTYHHDHQQLFQTMLETQKLPCQVFSTKQSMKAQMLLLAPQLDDNTIAFVLQNNFSSNSIQQLRSHLTPTPKAFQIHENYIRQKISVNQIPPFDSTTPQHYWVSDVERLSLYEHQVHTWPVSSNDFSSPSPILCIGGTDSHRLTTKENLLNLKSFFPHSRLEMIKGGHFAHQQGTKAAELIADSFVHNFKLSL